MSESSAKKRLAKRPVAKEPVVEGRLGAVARIQRIIDQERAPRFLLTRLSHIGDCILAAPIACALRRKFPKSTITWVVEGPSGKLLKGHEAVDHLIELPRRWLKKPTEVRKLRRQLKTLRCDIAIDPQSLSKSAVAGWLSGAPVRIALGGEYGRELSPWLSNVKVHATVDHVVDRGLQLLHPLGITKPQVEFRLPREPQDDQFASECLTAKGLAEQGVASRFALLNPGCGWESRRWPAERYGKVAQRFGSTHRLPSLVVWAGPEEEAWADQIVAASEGFAQKAPPTSLGQLAALTRQAAFYLGSDTGPLHVAVAVGTRAVALHGPTLPEKSGPYGPGHLAIQTFYQGGSSRERRRADSVAMRAITVDQVCQACLPLLVPESDTPRRHIA